MKKADKAIMEDKICPDCGGELEYDQADDQGRTAEDWFCPQCKNGKIYKIWFTLQYDQVTVDIPIDRQGSIKDNPQSFVRKMKYQSMGYKLREF